MNSAPVKPFEPFRQQRITAAEVITQTLCEKKDLFRSRWVPVVDLFDRIIHPYDKTRLLQTYQDEHTYEMAGINFLRSATWIEHAGEGMNTMFRVIMFPETTPTNLPDALDQLASYKSAMSDYKDLCQTFHDLLIAARHMELTTIESSERLNRAVALAALLHERAITAHNELYAGSNVVPAFREVTTEEIDSFIKDPSAHTALKNLRPLHKILSSGK